MCYDAQGTDPEEVIRNAFGCFDEDNIGLIHEDKLRELLTTIGDRYRQIFLSSRFEKRGIVMFDTVHIPVYGRK
jgi:Ca2+-binding EF-hand superfamily protein